MDQSSNRDLRRKFRQLWQFQRRHTQEIALALGLTVLALAALILPTTKL